jgi:LysR family transcriptional regulator, regulator for bpeEF and oprC
MNRLQAMQIFVRIVETGSFARAAAALAISRARATEAVQDLENLLSAQLLHRTTRRLSLTDDGRTYYQRAVRILSDIDEAESEIGESRAEVRGLLRADVPVALTRLFVLPQLPRFLKKHPRLQLEIRLENRSVQLLEEGVDCAVSYGVPVGLDCVVRPLATTHLLTCAAPSYLKRHRAPKNPADLSKHDCIGFLDPVSTRPALWQFVDDTRSTVHKPEGSLAFNAMEACVEAAAMGLGVTQVLSSVAHTAIREGRLVPLLIRNTSAGPSLHFTFLPNRQGSARLRVFAQFTKEVFAQIDSGWADIVAAHR